MCYHAFPLYWILQMHQIIRNISKLVFRRKNIGIQTGKYRNVHNSQTYYLYADTSQIFLNSVILRYLKKKIEVLYFSSYFIFCCCLFLEMWSISSFRFLPLSLNSDIWYQIVLILSNLNPNHSKVVFPDPILQELEYYLNLKIQQLKLYL